MQRRRTKSKKRCQEIHAKRRAIERFGIYLSTETIVKEIQQRKLQFIERQSNRVTVWRKVDVDQELDIIVIYDNIRKQVATVMPYNMYVMPQKREIHVKEENQKETKQAIVREETERSDPSYKEQWLSGC